MGSTDKIEQLFLLEVLIDKVVLYEVPPEVPIRVRIKFIEFPCFEITQQDFKKTVEGEEEEDPVNATGNFNSGKSFLFPMVPLDLIRNLQRYPLAVTVFKINDETPNLPEIVGQTRVRMSEGMSEVVHNAMQCNCATELPISYTLTETFALHNIGEQVGTVALFIRLSCFGQSIVTQFQLMGEKKAFLFKNSKADNTFQCKKVSAELNEGYEQLDPTRFDVLPVAPFLTSEDTVFDCYNKEGGENENLPVIWKVTPPKPVACPMCEPCPGSKAGTTRPFCMEEPPPCCCPGGKVATPKPCSPPKACLCCGKTKTPPTPNKNKIVECYVCGTCFPRPPENPCSKCKTPGPIRCPACGISLPDDLCGISQNFSDDTDDLSATKNPCTPNRYDTTGAQAPSCLECHPKSPCGFCGASCPGTPQPAKPPIQCKICGTPNPTTPVTPAVRYDTTGALSPAFQGFPPCKACGMKCPFFEPPNQPPKPEIFCHVCGASCMFTDAPKTVNNIPSTCSICGASCPFIESTSVLPKELSACSGCGTSCPFNDSSSLNQKPCSACGATCPFSQSPADEICDVCGSYLPPKRPPPPPSCVCHLEEAQAKPTPDVRYDTTGALSPAFVETPQPSPFCKCGGPAGEAYAEVSPKQSFGQGDGQAMSPFTSTAPVRQTGSTPDVMQTTTPDFGFVENVRKLSISEPQIPTSGKVNKGHSKHKKKSKKWTPKWGLQYPGIKVGHRNCVEAYRLVPPGMGWMWNIKKSNAGLTLRKGWKPGSIGATISNMMNEHRRLAGRPPMQTKSKSAKWKSGRGGGGRQGPNGPHPPTLHVHRREGAYYISMHPLDLGADAVNVPLQFKIPKQEREEDDEDASSTESELEIEFMAPGAFEVLKPPPELKSMGTQYRDLDVTGEKPTPKLHLGDDNGKKKGASIKGPKKGQKPKVAVVLPPPPPPPPPIDPSVLAMFSAIQPSPSGRKGTAFVKAPVGGYEDEDDDDSPPAKGISWTGKNTSVIVGKGSMKKK